MASETPPVVFDHDNLEWTEADFARALQSTSFPTSRRHFQTAASRVAARRIHHLRSDRTGGGKHGSTRHFAAPPDSLSHSLREAMDS